MGGCIGWVGIVFVALLLLGVAFAIHPLLGLAVLIVGGVYAVGAAQNAKETEKREQEQARKEESDRVARVEEERLEIERERLAEEQMERQTATRRVAMTPEARAEEDREREAVARLIQELSVLSDGNTIRDHGTLDGLRHEKVVCENGHESTYGQFESAGGGSGCPVCKSDCYCFVEEGTGRFRFCPNRIRQKGAVDRFGKEYAYLHSVAVDLAECPVCSWAMDNGLKIQPHGFSLHERSPLPARAVQ